MGFPNIFRFWPVSPKTGVKYPVGLHDGSNMLDQTGFGSNTQYTLGRTSQSDLVFKTIVWRHSFPCGLLLKMYSTDRDTSHPSMGLVLLLSTLWLSDFSIINHQNWPLMTSNVNKLNVRNVIENIKWFPFVQLKQLRKLVKTI